MKSFSLKSDLLLINPVDEEDLWEGDWEILYRKDENVKIGVASFKGEKLLGAIPLHVELEPRYRDRGLGTEAIRMMVNWAFLYKNIYEIISVVDRENDKAIAAIQKAGFVYRKEEVEEDVKYEIYSIIKEKTSWTGIYVMIGIVIGLILGLVLGNLWVGFAVGMVACIGTGILMDTNSLKYRESVTGRNERFVQHLKK